MSKGRRIGKHTVRLAVVTLLFLSISAAGCRSHSASPSPAASPLESPLQSPTTVSPESDVPAQAAGRLLFHSNRAGQYDIYILDLATGETTQLTDGPEHDLEPAMSPDGTLIAFARARADLSGQDIWVMGADGSNPRRLTTLENSIGTCPDWSPDGSQIVFYATQASRFHIFVVSLSSGEVKELPYGGQNDMMPDWSPDGQKIVFASDRGGKSDLYIMNADGSGLQQLTDSWANEWRPRWSPDGRTIAFQGNQGEYSENWNLYLLEIATGKIEPLTEGDLDSDMPSWSPDGGTIYFAHGNVVQTADAGSWVKSSLWAIDLQERSFRELARSAEADDAYPTWIPQ